MVSQVLLLSIPKGNNQGTIPGKLFEYLACQKPIVCLGSEACSAGEIISECESGKTFIHSNKTGIENYLQQLYNNWEQGKDTTIQSTTYKKYARKELTKKLSEVIEGLF